MKKLYILLFVAIGSFSFAQTTITQWNFDASSTAPSTGTGTISLIGGTEENIQTGTGACNCPFVAGNPSTGKSYSIKTFQLSGAGSGTAGFKFAVNTTGFTGITVSFDPRGSNTSSRYQQYEYTTDGTTWNIISNNSGALVSAFTSTPMVTLTLPATCNNNANFAFRIVSIFAPSTTDYSPVGYMATPTPSTYAATGAWRIDNVTFTGSNLSTSQNSISGLKLYPNPVTNGTLYIESDLNSEKNVNVFDVLGKQVINTTISNNAVNVSKLTSGVYIVKVTEDGKTATRKLVIK